MVQTLVRRPDRLGDIARSVIDECHHGMALTWREALALTPGARVLGTSATPERLDGKGLREIFDALVRGPSVKKGAGCHGSLSMRRSVSSI